MDEERMSTDFLEGTKVKRLEAFSMPNQAVLESMGYERNS
jgi:hypothetical protein